MALPAYMTHWIWFIISFLKNWIMLIEVLSNYVNGNVDAKLMSDYDCVYGGT